MSDLVIKVDDPSRTEVKKLIKELDNYLSTLYPAEHNHLLPIKSLRQPNVILLTVNLRNEVVGCGAIVNHNGEYAEIKRMYVLPDYRGLRIGHRLLDALELHARPLGLQVMRLETGISQHEAIRLYERAGYTRRPPFGDYLPDPLSVFMEKNILHPTV